MQAPVLVTAPAALAVSLTEAKAHLRVTDSAEDSLIGIYLASAIQRLDGWTGVLGRCLVSQTWRQDLAEFRDVMALPFPSVSDASISYYDGDNVLRVLDDANFTIVNTVAGAQIEIAEGGTFPATYSRPDAVQITLTCGYGSAADVPPALKSAILLHVALQFTQRADGAFPASYRDMIAPYRVVGV